MPGAPGVRYLGRPRALRRPGYRRGRATTRPVLTALRERAPLG